MLIKGEMSVTMRNDYSYSALVRCFLDFMIG